MSVHDRGNGGKRNDDDSPDSSPPSSRMPLSTRFGAPRQPPPQAQTHPPSSRRSVPPPASGPPSTLSSMQKAIVALDKVKARLDALERQKTEPIAILGMACRFPGGGTTPEAYFQFLLDGGDAVTQVPRERWQADLSSEADADPERRATRWGAFLRDPVDCFDARFFGISPREAAHLDPQQRLLLELAWEALERAGQDPASLLGSQTGVFVGTSTNDYLELCRASPEGADVYAATGNGPAFASGRLSYALGLQGPSVAVDTACSSSLVAVHLACQSLRSGEATMALAGGVNLMLSPSMMRLVSTTKALAPDGRCRTFDAGAGGFVRGEGGGIVVLKLLSDAQRDGDPILATLRGSAVNQDGRSTGLTTPNVLSQQAMLRQALTSARVSPDDIGYVEAHGTGTPLGDPIELEALKAVVGKHPRLDRSRCVLGAVKTNVGHLEAAAGIAGLVKAVMALQREVIPKNLHFRALNPRISLDGTPFVIPTENLPWRRGDKARLVGVSSFGLSGTNAHVILEESTGDRLNDVPAPEQSSYVVPISARSPGALRALARAYAAMLSDPRDARLHDIAYSAGVRRTHHEHRLAIAGKTPAEIAAAFAAFAESEAPAARTSGERRPKVVFVFPGQGSQWIGMARRLLREEKAFREAIEVYEEPIRRLGGISVQEQLALDEASSRLGEIHVVQPVLFAIEVALANLWRSWGVEPDAVVGHSMGEVAAARISGVLTLEDAVKVICRRSRLLRKVSGKGAMALVELSLPVAQQALDGYEDRLSVAVSNGPSSTVLSGEPEALDEVLGALESAGVFCRRVKVDVASHSPQMDPLREDLMTALRNVQPRPARLLMRSTVAGEPVRGPELDASYWVKNLREPVLFGATTQRLIDDGYTVFIEMSPHPILLQAVEENLRAKNKDGAAIASMRRDTDERRSLLGALGALYARGFPVDWKRLFPYAGRCVDLPTYAWQRERYWVEGAPPVDRPGGPPAAAPEASPSRRENARDGWLWELAWRRRDRIPGGPPAQLPPGAWLVLSDRGGTGEALVQWLRARGRTAVHAVVGTALRHVAPGLWEMDPADPGAYQALLREASPGAPFAGVVSLLGLTAPGREDTTAETLAHAQRLGAESALLLSQAILRAGSPEVPRVWLLTRGAVAAGGEARLSIAQAPLWGLGRTLQGEHPELGCTLLDLAPEPLEGEIDAIGAELCEARGEDQIALRAGGRFAARLASSSLRLHEGGVRLGANASYLVTGGLGGLGLAVADWLVERGARHVVLAGRRPPSGAAREAIARMEARGAQVLVATADVSREADVAALVARIGAELPALRGVVHAAGVLADRTVLDLSVDAMRAVAAPKIAGAWNLSAATRDLALDFFVLYGSAASLLGLAGQANYAAANAFLDALAHDRRACGLPALTIDWGPFSGVGLAAAEAGRGDRLGAMGFQSLTPAEGNAVLGALLATSAVQVGVMPIDAGLVTASIPRVASAPYFEDLARAGAPAAAPRPPLEILREAAPADRPAMLEQVIREELARILRLEPGQIERTEPFHAHGFDSLMALELRNRLGAALGLKLTVADIVGHSRVDALAQLLLPRLDVRGAPQESTSQPTLRPGPPEAPRPGSWVVIPRPAPSAGMRLFCFPYGGGAAHVFSSWPAGLPPEVEVCAIQPPGRYERLHEPLPQSVDEMVAGVVTALLPYLDRPFAMFGHCLGAVVMFEAVRELSAKHGKKPTHLFASGAPAPDRYRPPSVEGESAEVFRGLLRTIGFAREEVLGDADVERYLIPAVRADFDAAARYRHVASAPLDVPITSFAGRDDPFARPELVEAWRGQTTASYTEIVFSGEHYFIVPEREAILRLIGQVLVRG